MLERQLKELPVEIPMEIEGLVVTLHQTLPETLNVDNEQDLFLEANIASISNGNYTFITEMFDSKYYTYILQNGNPSTIHTFLPENDWILDELKENILNFDELLEGALEDPNEGYY